MNATTPPYNPMSPDAAKEPKVARYRVAYPVLRRLPLTNFRDHAAFSPSLQRCVAGLEKGATEILARHGIVDPDEIGLAQDDDYCVPEVDVIWRLDALTRADMIPTLYMNAEWKHDSQDTWPVAMREIVNFMYRYLRQHECNDEVFAEIIAFERTIPKYLSCPPHIPGLAEKWPSLQEELISMLDSFPATSKFVNTVGLFRLGFYEDKDMNPTTVYISLDSGSDETGWGAVCDQLKEFLRSEGWGILDVHLEHNHLEQDVFQPLVQKGTPYSLEKKIAENDLEITGRYQRTVNLGDGLGAAQYIKAPDGSLYSSLIGTLGCYIEVRYKGSCRWQKLALTNYHVIRPCLDGMVLNLNMTPRELGGNPAETSDQNRATAASTGTPVTGSELLRADFTGFRHFDHSPKMVESPSRIKHDYTMWRLNNRIQWDNQKKSNPSQEAERSQRLKELQEEKAEKSAFFDQGRNILGRVMYASGYGRRSQRNGRLDWALIEVYQARQGENRLPQETVWQKTFLRKDWCPHQDTFGALLKHPSQSLRTMDLGTRVWKCSTITGVTGGTYSEYRVSCSIRRDRHVDNAARRSAELVIVGEVPPGSGKRECFAGHGDSGAVVFDHSGRVVGLLFAAQTPQQIQSGDGYTLVTPIEEVFEDIKVFSQGEIEAIRVAL